MEENKSTLRVCARSKARTRLVSSRIRKKAISQCKPKKKYKLAASNYWRVGEKTDLMNGLYKYGALDLKSLGREVTTRTASEIDHCLRIAWRRARILSKIRVDERKENSTRAPIEEWLERVEQATQSSHSFNSVYCKALPAVFLCMSKYEKHPDPADCGGFDFSEAYDFMHSMLSGMPGKALSPPTATFIMECLGMLGDGIRRREYKKTRILLSNGKKPVKKPVPEESKSNDSNTSESESSESEYSSDDESPQFQAMKLLMDSPGFNPMKFPLARLKKKSRPNISSTHTYNIFDDHQTL